jgi:hypothetical protein
MPCPGLLDRSCLLCYIILRVFQSPAVQDRREHQGNRNGDATCRLRFFYGPPILRCGILSPQVRRIIPWHKGP